MSYSGNLALSRALGDFEFKQNSGLKAEEQVVTANPDIIVHEPQDEDEFFVIACDGQFWCSLPIISSADQLTTFSTKGIWDVMSSQHTIDYVRQSIKARKDLDQICEELMDYCLAPDSDCSGVGCDNMTVLIVALLKGRTLEQWYDSIAQKLDNGVGYDTPTLDQLPTPFHRTRDPNESARGGGAGNSLGQVLSGTSLLYNRPGGSGGEDDSDEEDNLLSRLQSALEQQGIHIVHNDSEEDGATIEESEDAEMDTAPSTHTSESNMSNETNGEVPHPAVNMEGLSDKVCVTFDLD